LFAGIGAMTYGKFASFNIVGGIAWVTSFLFIGYFFGGLPVIKEEFHLRYFRNHFRINTTSDY
jgi:membrane-associated protein